MEREYYIFRYFDNSTNLDPVRQEFKLFTNSEMLEYLSLMRRSHYSVVVYKRLDI